MYLDEAIKAIKTEKEGLDILISSLNDNFNQAVEIIKDCKYHVAISGMGKAGLVGAKISATLASTGTPSFFMHPAEAIHGDFGMLKKEDVVVLLSYGGETEEIVRLLPMLKVMGNKIIAITRSKDSSLGKEVDVVLTIGDLTEACPMGLAPTTSTTAMMALGDALATVLLQVKNFNEKKFAFFHPGGSLGKKLLKVHEVMRSGEKCPVLNENQKLKDVLVSITSAGAGAALIMSNDRKLTGIFTDGDLRRFLNSSSDLSVVVKDVMTKNPKSVRGDSQALKAVAILKEYMIGELPVITDNGEPVGMITLKDCVNIGLLEKVNNQ